MPIEFGKLALQTAPGTASPFPMDSKKPLPTGKPPSPDTAATNMDLNGENHDENYDDLQTPLDGTLTR